MTGDQTGKDNPTPRPSMADFFERQNAKNEKLPPKVVGAEEVSANLPPEPTQEQQIERHSAQQLTKTANEIKDIINRGDIKPTSFDENYFRFSVATSEGIKGTISLSYLLTESMSRPNGKKASIIFKYSPQGDTDFGKEIGTDGKFELVTMGHNDLESKEAFDEFSKKNPRRENFARTRYYFDENGNFGKVSTLPIELSDQREPLTSFSLFTKSVKSEVTPDDFELAGTALKAILDKLKSQGPQAPET